MEPDYESYSLEELEDARRQIDPRRYPKRFKSLEAELLRRRSGFPEASLAARCLSCSAALKRGTVRPLLARSAFAAGLVGEIVLWAFGAVLVALFSLSFWLAGAIVGVVGVTAFVAYAMRSNDGYICTECGAHYAPWQVKN